MQLQAAPAEAEADPGPRPELAAFDYNHAAYDEAVAQWAADRAAVKASAKVRERDLTAAAEQYQAAIVGKWQAQCADYARSHPDFEISELANRDGNEFPVTEVVLGALLQAGNGPQILDHFRQNVDELKRISRLPTGRIPIEIGAIAARLSMPVRQPAPRAPSPPANRIGSSGSRAVAEKDPNEMSISEWAAKREPELMAARCASMFGARS